MKIALIGYGYWGKNLARVAERNSQSDFAAVIDSNSDALKTDRALPRDLPRFKSLEECLNQTSLDGAIIATPPDSHFEIAKNCLEKGLHILVEKPFVTEVAQAKELEQLAASKNKKIMVDFTYVFHPSVLFLKNLSTTGKMGDLLYFDSTRVNFGKFQSTNVLWDLAPHDLSILDSITGGRLPTHVSCVGADHVDSKTTNMCYLSMKYESGFLAHMHLNWLAPIKIRKVILGGSDRMIVFDDNRPTEKIKIYEKKVDVDETSDSELRVSYRFGDMRSPAIPEREPLQLMYDHFVSYISGRSENTPTGIEMGKRVTSILSAASKSLDEGGSMVPVTL